MDLKKQNTIIILLFFVFSQMIYPIQGILTIAETFGTSYLKVIEEETKEDGKKPFKIYVDKELKQDSLEIKLPSKSTFNKKKLLKDLDEKSFDYDSKENILTFNESVQEISLELDNLENKKYDLILKAYKGKEKVDEYSYKFEYTSKTLDSKELKNVELKETEALQGESTKKILSGFAPSIAPELQRDINVSPVLEQIDSGRDIVYKLVLKTTGSQFDNSKVNLVVDLPKNKYVYFTQDLDELIIDGVTPTYNKEKNQLIYSFENLETGQTYEQFIKFNTLNGEMLDNEEVTLKASLLFDQMSEIYDQTSIATSKIKASASSTISKSVSRVTYGGEEGLPTPNGNIMWEIKASFPFKKTGQMFLKPGTPINIVDTLPDGLTYRKDIKEEYGNIVKISNDGKTLTWTFTAPSIEEQMKNENVLFEKTINFWTRVDNNDKWIGEVLTNNASVSGTGQDDKPTPTSKTSQKITIYGSAGGPILPEGTAGVHKPYFYGPKNGVGGQPTYPNLNPNPTVPDTAILQFTHDFKPYKYAAGHDMKKWELITTFDENLFLYQVEMPRDFWKVNQESIPTPDFTFQLTFLDKNNQTKDTKIKNPKPGKSYTASELGMQPGDRAIEGRFIFEGSIPKGINSIYRVGYYFNIREGFEGEVTNKFNMTGESTYDQKNDDWTKGKYRSFDLRKDFPEFYDPKQNDYTGDRTANVRKRSEFTPPITRIGVSLANHSNGEVKPGQNRLTVNFQNQNSSQRSVEDPLESAVLLPPGVTVSKTPNDSYKNDNKEDAPGKFVVLDENYEGTGRQLIKFTWDNEYLENKYIRPNKNVLASIDVDISEYAPTSLYFDVYGFFGNEIVKVPTVTNPTLKDTLLEKDLDDLNKDNKNDTLRIKSRNSYFLFSPYNLKTEKKVKGTDNQWGDFVKTTPGGDIDYKLHMSNTTGKDLSNMTLFDVLPSVGDIGITDNISRGSQFMPYLKGPITLPKEWEGKVEVYYSTEKNPKRDELKENTDYPSGTAQLGNPADATNPNWKLEKNVSDWKTIRSFKIELLPGKTWIKGVDMDIYYTMTAPTIEQATNKGVFDPKVNPIERAAWNSFAVATDKGQPVEPKQVGVYMDAHIGQIKIKKIDNKTKSPLQGAVFEIKNKEGSLSYSVTSDKEGNAVLTDIPLGEYIIKEVNAPDGYTPLEQDILINITNDTYIIEKTIENKKAEGQGQVQIKKIDGKTGKPLADATFEISSENGSTQKTVVTDKDGIAELKNLPFGKYEVKEITAPDGYALLQKSLFFEVDEKNTLVELTIKNFKKAPPLPETGGIGTLIFYAIGGSIMLGGVWMLLSSKRRESK